MITLRKSDERGQADHGWLKAKYSFSFSSYYDEKFMGHSVLRVINEDRIQGGGGFATHGHNDMEIITYVVEGALEHKDSMGNSTRILPGEVQRMSAGTGVRHSEFNHSQSELCHLLQIWILPEQLSIPPSYGQKSFKEELAQGDWVLTVSKQGREGSISVNQDIELYVCKSLQAGKKSFTSRAQRHQWAQVVRGELSINGITLSSGDGAAISKETELSLQWKKDSEFLFFDLP